MKNLLPVGSIVQIEGGTRKTVIIGILQYNQEKPDKLYDYLGVPYPEGFIGQGSTYLFNHEAISEVVYKGFEDEERKKFMNLVDKIQKGIENI